eukprot:GEZU01023995.1.p1 GENE.GEZU01023995.1~~GEZU01023995.1.p1  ORF type:complete len:139 (+),score=1.25 GEZU01023995.1:271-687(+)
MHGEEELYRGGGGEYTCMYDQRCLNDEKTDQVLLYTYMIMMMMMMHGCMLHADLPTKTIGNASQSLMRNMRWRNLTASCQECWFVTSNTTMKPSPVLMKVSLRLSNSSCPDHDHDHDDDAIITLHYITREWKTLLEEE